MTDDVNEFLFGANHCWHLHAYRGVIIQTNGVRQVKDFCRDCGRVLANWKKDGDSPDLPVARDYRHETPRCEVCNSIDSELHHWAPRHLFEAEAASWPTAYLCPPCHRRWHSIVTPNMGKKLPVEMECPF